MRYFFVTIYKSTESSGVTGRNVRFLPRMFTSVRAGHCRGRGIYDTVKTKRVKKAKKEGKRGLTGEGRIGNIDKLPVRGATANQLVQKTA